MSTADVSHSAPHSFSVRRVVLTLLPIVALLGGYVAYKRHAYQAEAQQEGERLLLGTLGLAKPTKNKLDARFVDADGDLVADAPQDTTKWIDPDVLHFSYIAGEDARRQQDVWQQFCDALATATGKKVEYLLLDSPEDQLRALHDGRLEIAGVNTGNVPTAVNACGFVPVSTLGTSEGSFGYAVNFLVPADSSLQNIQDVRGKTIALTEKGSNSGYKAPLVLLMSDFNIFPQRDFDWVYTFGHEASIKGIAAGKYQVAPVASDMLARAIVRGETHRPGQDSDQDHWECSDHGRSPPGPAGIGSELDGRRKSRNSAGWPGLLGGRCRRRRGGSTPRASASSCAYWR